MMRIRSWMVGMVLTGLAVSAASAGGLEKKLIHFGYDMYSPRPLVEKIGELQHLPFDGLTVRSMRKYENVFGYRGYDPAEVEANVEAMSRVKWGKFTDNFMYMSPGVAHPLTDTGTRAAWFDEAVWGDDGYVLKNLRAIARMGRAGKCKGIFFDPEYGGDWDYRKQKHSGEKSVAEYRAMVRKRGAQFIDAIEAEMPNPVFLTLFWSFNKVTALQEVAYAQDPKLMNDIIGGARYGLLHDFVLGNLEGADRGTMIVDGNEASYYSDDFEDYNRQYHYIRQTMLGAIPEELRTKYRAQVHVGHAVFVDFHYNTRGLAVPSTYMTPEERDTTMEWVVYHSLKNSDKYVWFWAEKVLFVQPEKERTIRITPEMLAAIERARQKVARNEEIGFDYRPLQKRAWAAYHRALSDPVEPSRAEIVRAVSTPKIDGKLDDEVWKNASQLGPFQSFRTATRPLDTTTMGYMAYDDTNLYIAFRSEDPAMDKLGASYAHDVWPEEEVTAAGGNCVEVAIAADKEGTRYYHIKLNYKNKRWDSLTPASVWPKEIRGKDSYWDGEYETATHVDKTFWSVEMAIPWKTLNRQAPMAGERIKGNLILRASKRGRLELWELSSWSLRVKLRFVEAKTFGTWEFE